MVSDDLVTCNDLNQHQSSGVKASHNSTTYCYICQSKFTSAFYLSMHLKSLNHRKEILRIYDSILETTLLDELIAKESDILASDESDDNNDNALLDYERYDRLMNENAGLKNNIFKYLDLITTEDLNRDEPGLHEKVMEQLDRFIENIYITKDISTENTLELLKQFNQEVEDVKAAVKCVKGEFPLVSEAAKKGIVQQHNLVNLLKDQYTELCEDMKKKLAELNKVKIDHEYKNDDGTAEEKCQNTSLPMGTTSKSETNFDPCESTLKGDLKEINEETGDTKKNIFRENTGDEIFELANICEDPPNTITAASEEINGDVMENTMTQTENRSSILINSHNVTSGKLDVNEDSKILRMTSTSVGTNSVDNNSPKKQNSKSETLNISMDAVTVQLNIEPVIANVVLPTARHGVETNLTGDNCSKERNKGDLCESLQNSLENSKINEKLIQQLQVTISELKLSHELETDSKDYKTVQDKNFAKEKHEGCETKKNNIKTSSKNKRTKVKNKNKSLVAEKCYSKIKEAHQEKSNNVSYESKIMGTTKWHVRDDSVGSSNQQSEKIKIKIEGDINSKENIINNELKICTKDNSYIKITVDQMNQHDNMQKKPHSENPNNYVTVKEIPHIVSKVTNENSSCTEHASNMVQVDQSTNSREKGDTLEGPRVFNLKRIKIKIFARLKRKIPEKLRSENSDKHSLDEEKVVIEVTSLIKKVYMSDDIPLGLTLGLFENFNKDLESKFKDLEKS